MTGLWPPSRVRLHTYWEDAQIARDIKEAIMEMELNFNERIETLAGVNLTSTIQTEQNLRSRDVIGKLKTLSALGTKNITKYL